MDAAVTSVAQAGQDEIKTLRLQTEMWSVGFHMEFEGKASSGIFGRGDRADSSIGMRLDKMVQMWI